MEDVAAQTISSGVAYLWPLVREVPGVWGLLLAEVCVLGKNCVEFLAPGWCWYILMDFSGVGGVYLTENV